ncbi:DUF4363 domain-containing protein [Fischerella sp. JS2]|uniref:DUF4363 domain-containing protein n=1 Tax=Fischerella sp. JS2 TaxID=2597771 RepID=UPI0028EEF35C|nr:DUF4363 domain-containing protein [Fischerella sp. JS2]
MHRFNQVLLITTISMSFLVGCNNAEQSTTQTSPTATSTPASAISKKTATTTVKDNNFKSLLAIVSNTQTAVKAGDFTKAKQEFDKFEDSWSKVEDGVKKKSSKTYNAIEDEADKIKGDLKASAPNKDKVLAALESLNTNINSVAKP